MMWMLQSACEKNSMKKPSTQRPRVSPQLTLETHTHPCDRSMDVGTCLPGEVVSNGDASSQELGNTMKIAGELCGTTDEASLSLVHLPPRVDRHDVLANMFRNPTKQYKDARMLTLTCA